MFRLAGKAIFQLFICQLLSLSCTAHGLVVPFQDKPQGDKFEYVMELIGAAIKALPVSKRPVLELTPQPMVFLRFSSELRFRNPKIDLAWLPCSKKVDSKLLRYPFPIYMGLLGARVFITTKDVVRRLEGKTLDFVTLKSMKIAVGQDWDDYQIMKKAGLNLVPVASHSELYTALASGKADLVTRSVIEAGHEIQKLKPRFPKFEVESTVILYYPQCHFVYGSKATIEKQRELHGSYVKLSKSGRLKAIFLKRYAGRFDMLDIKNRNVIHIDNTAVPDTLKGRDNSNLWYQF